jgi:predicted permease
MMLMNKVTESIFRIIFRIFCPMLFFVKHTETENSEREIAIIFLGGLRNLWEKEVISP